MGPARRRGSQGRDHRHRDRLRPPGPRRAACRGAADYPNASSSGYDFVGDAFNADRANPAYNPVPVRTPTRRLQRPRHTRRRHRRRERRPSKAWRPASPSAPTASSAARARRPTTSCSRPWSARADGVDVVNMSIGGALQWPQVPDRAGRRHARQTRHCRRRVDRQRGRARPLLRRRARRGDKRHRRRVVRQLAREPSRSRSRRHGHRDRLRRATVAAGADLRGVSDGEHRHAATRDGATTAPARAPAGRPDWEAC